MRLTPSDLGVGLEAKVVGHIGGNPGLARQRGGASGLGDKRHQGFEEVEAQLREPAPVHAGRKNRLGAECNAGTHHRVGQHQIALGTAEAEGLDPRHPPAHGGLQMLALGD